MPGEQLYVSHAPGDVELVQELFATVKNFPIGVHVALEEVESGRSRKRLEGRIANSDVVVAVLTDRSEHNQWIHQEIGYARAKGIPIVPMYDSEKRRAGFVDDAEGVAIDRENPSVTVFNLLSRLRSELAPLGALSVPNWYVQFPCTVPNCDQPVVLEIDRDQTKLWKLHRNGHRLSADCDGCGSRYYFDPGTIGYLGREEPNGRRQ
ncbi:TIR domain-containing protein [Halobiforma haloterrestris]|uniref:TIR domain-containing protein n=1 Tax=Natronobacterium haloterrestre TaxID=148448 RepID=A0A1I1IIM1_NATHA|nr:toll/interleukin-1 receptor domain-containing protein [Halobiforma haloterrestris]SFC36087.1 TIR domain-containing protein [Halobiforma haloterrestris]